MRTQKKNRSGDFIFALVPYEFDFVDGSNLLSVWGGCEDEASDMSAMPGRHTWYSKEYNDLLCEAGSVFGDEAKRNELYSQAERILVEDVAWCPSTIRSWWPWSSPYVKGPMFEASDAGQMTWNRFRFSSRESKIYHSTSNRE